MRVVVTIPHYYEPRGRATEDGREHGSTGLDPEPRRVALTACVEALWRNYGPRQHVFDIEQHVSLDANRTRGATIDIVVCTTRGRHLLGSLPLPIGAVQHHATRAEPLLLGFECQAVLRDCLGYYDYYAYLEDDLITRDPWLFRKLAWFTSTFGDDSLLQPNRYEVGPLGVTHKIYIDGPIRAQATASFQDLNDRPSLSADFLNVPIGFDRAKNPHAGCYFLNASQMEHWSKRPFFLDRDTGFVGPLESAATLGVMRTFRLYKGRHENASFLEIEHFGTEFLNFIIGAGGFSSPDGQGAR
ncbi:MAG: hypothetical protein P4L84_15220 [Isosphaeraceae bacterium]|nr:hypothetical protein [Isosphaeraceae bacterium]